MAHGGMSHLMNASQARPRLEFPQSQSAPGPGDRGRAEREAFATSFVITFEIKSNRHGTYGTTLTANLTKALGNKRNPPGLAATREGSTFSPRCSVVVMDPSRSTATVSNGAEVLFRSFVQGERGGKLRSQLALLHPDASAEEIEDAIQTACDRFVDKAEGISAPGQVYTWIRTTAHRVLSREDDHHRRELAVDPTGASLQELAAEEPGPEEETIEHEDEAELVALVREVSASLPERKRDVLALYSAGYKRPEIASRLGLSDRAVKRDLLEIMDEARAAIARKAGGGCQRGEPLVLRFAYGLASAAEAEQARLHMKGCRRCEVLWERLDAWREKAAALLPVPAVEQASPGLLERLAHRTADGLASVKQQVLGGASQVKQQAATTYSRAVDPTPLAGARPGTVAALLVSCVTIGEAPPPTAPSTTSTR